MMHTQGGWNEYNCFSSPSMSFDSLLPYWLHYLLMYLPMYRWNRGTICVHDIIMGSFWSEVYGKVNIVNKKTGDEWWQQVGCGSLIPLLLLPPSIGKKRGRPSENLCC